MIAILQTFLLSLLLFWTGPSAPPPAAPTSASDSARGAGVQRDDDDDDDWDDDDDDDDDDDEDEDDDDDDLDDDDDGEDDDDLEWEGGRRDTTPRNGEWIPQGANGIGGAGLAGGVTIVRGPYLQLGTSDAMTVRWRTSAPTASLVRYGTSADALDREALGRTGTREHEVRLTGLRPDTRYFYAVGPAEHASPAGSFRTSPPIGAKRPVRIWVIGDSGLRGAGQRRVLEAYAAHVRGAATDVWLMLGDNAYTTGTDRQYQAGFFEPYREPLRTTVVWPTRGNHDEVRSQGADYYDFFTLPTAGEAGGVPSRTEAYYSFDFASVHFICLNSEEVAGSRGSAMIEWLRRDLAATRQDWIIAFWHRPPYSKGSHDSDSDPSMREIRERFVPVLEEGGADLVLCGHSHAYERSFLLDGHHGPSRSLQSSMILDRGQGPTGGGDAFRKPVARGPGRGTVYAVVGSSAKLSTGRLNHPAHARSIHDLGSLAVRIDGARLEASFVDDAGRVADRFTIVKEAGAVSFDGDDPAGRPRMSGSARGARPRAPRRARLAVRAPHAPSAGGSS